VQALVMMAQLIDVVTLLVREVAFDEELAREVVVARERAGVARRAAPCV
jgi:hypothetical protein